ncbi:MAG TPA: hypothetical protein VF941_05485 [Clostridia bacterium]
MRKVFIFIVAIIGIIIIGIVSILIKLHIAYNQDIAIIDNLDKKYYQLFENEFLLKFPDSTKIEEVALTNGRDSCLSARIVFNETDVIKFNQSIEFETEPDVNSKYEKVLKYKNTKNYMKIKYLAPENSKRRICLIKYELIGKDVFGIMKAAGFHSIKSR